MPLWAPKPEEGKIVDRPQQGPRLQLSPKEPFLALQSHQMAEMTAQQIGWTFNQSQAKAAGTYCQLSPKQNFHLYQMIVIILAWSY